MNVGGILLIILVPIVLLVIAYVISRAIFRVVMLVMTVVFIVSLIGGGLLLFDAYAFTNEIDEGPTRFLLDEHEAGISTRNGSLTLLNASNLDQDPTSTVFIVSSVFLSDNATAGYDTANVSRSDALAAIEASDPHTSFARSLARIAARSEDDVPAFEAAYEQSLRDRFGVVELRSYLFGQLLAGTLAEDGPDAIILGIRNGTIDVEPQRPVVTFITKMPSAMVEQALSVEVEA